MSSDHEIAESMTAELPAELNNGDQPEVFNEEDAEKLGSLIEAVVTTPYKYSNHIELLALLKKAGPGALDDELHEARQRMSGLFLMDETFWLSWIEDETRIRDDHAKANNGVYDDEGSIKLLELYARSVNDLLSVRLWKSYVEFVMKEHDREVSEGKDGQLSMFDSNTVDIVLVEAVNATGYCVPDSHEIWSIYKDAKLASVKSKPSPESIALIKRYYLARLRIPHSAIGETFSEYSSFITQYENHNYEKELVAANKLVAETRRTLRELEPYEDHLKFEPTDINVWAQYIDVAIARPKKYFDQQLPKTIYERALAQAPTISAIWDQYLLFLLDQSFSFSVVDNVLERAVKGCPRSGTLWAHMIRTRERFNSSPELIAESKDRAFATGQLNFNAEEYSIVAAAWLSYLRRQLVDSPELFYEQAEAAMQDFESSFPSKTRKDEKYILPQMYITVLSRQGLIAEARSQWESLKSKHARSSEFWLNWFSWEKSVCLVSGDIVTPANVLENATNVKSMDLPERVCAALLAFERDFGSAFSMEKAEIKVKKLMRSVQRRRAMDGTEHSTSQQSESVAVVETEDKEEEQLHTKRKADEKEVKLTKKTKTMDPPVRDREHSTVTVEGLPIDATENNVRQFFQDCGQINSVNLVVFKGSATATLEFETSDDVLSAQTRDQKVFRGNTITVRRASGSTLWVTNFPSAADENYIRDIFTPFGEIVDIRFPSLTVNNKRRFCYVQFVKSEDATQAQSTLHDSTAPALPTDTNGDAKVRKLIVKVSDPTQRETRHGAVYEGRELFVRNIPLSFKEPALRSMFEKYGPLERIHLPSKDELFHTHQGFGFVTFEKVDDAKKAIELDLTKVGDRILNVSVAEVRKLTRGDRGRGGGFGLGRGRGGRGHDQRSKRIEGVI
ncbi:hypothetical protein V1512DRAFT_284317 [Lipomyces arxii]|uniref:uncharacterized protein n=1 Tax=Lipomyces arxii TaxID=56418 RepID=UPI0034CE9636